MPDWQKLVRELLALSLLPLEIRDEIVSELAAHLEERYEAACLQCQSAAEAVELTLQEVEDWRVLAAEIDRAKSEDTLMNHRSKSLWLPALITLLGASLSLMLTQLTGLQPRLVWIGNMGMTFYWPWLASLPIFGAAGGYLSRRAEGRTRAQLIAGVSPALVMLVVMFLILPWGLAIDGFEFFRLVRFGLGLINWVVIPGVALVLGAAPFLRRASPSRKMLSEV